jgi:hypothetical protein
MPTPNRQPDWTQCPECGSEFFQEAQFQRYSSSPRGLYRADEAAPPGRVKICLCGYLLPVDGSHPLPPSLQESIDRAQRFRRNNRPDKILTHLERFFVTGKQFQTVVDRLNQLLDIFQKPPADAPVPR